MSSSEKVVVQLLVDAGKATPAGPMAQQIGPTGANLGKVVAEINQLTAEFKGMKVPVKVTVDKKTREFEIEVGLPPASSLILNEAGLEKGSGETGHKFVGDLTFKQVLKVAQMKMSDMLASDVKAAASEILGTMVSTGVTCEGLHPKEAQKKLKEGEYDAIIEEFQRENPS